MAERSTGQRDAAAERSAGAPTSFDDGWTCFVCQRPFLAKASYGARILPPLVQACSEACFTDPRFADINHARRLLRARQRKKAAQGGG